MERLGYILLHAYKQQLTNTPNLILIVCILIHYHLLLF
jgi:hypothetical protein